MRPFGAFPHVASPIKVVLAMELKQHCIALIWGLVVIHHFPIALVPHFALKCEN